MMTPSAELVALCQDVFADPDSLFVLRDYLLDYPDVVQVLYQADAPWYVRAAIAAAARGAEMDEAVRGIYSECPMGLYDHYIFLDPASERLPFCLSTTRHTAVEQLLPTRVDLVTATEEYAIERSYYAYNRPWYCGDRCRPMQRRRYLRIYTLEGAAPLLVVPQMHTQPLPQWGRWPMHIRPYSKNLILFRDEASVRDYLFS